MSREFKFRFWKPEEKRWVNFPSRSGIKSFESLVDPVYTDSSYFIIQQFTGLTDKNGKEIYEGDIVKIPIINGQYEGLTELREVKWDSRELRWGLVRKGYESMCQGISYYKTDIEIVGNIYENPDLLK